MLRKDRKTRPPLRQQVVSDLAVQGALLRHLALYGFSCLVYFSLILLVTESMADPLRSKWEIAATFLDEAIYWTPGLLVLLPMFAYDLLSVSNRFTGPVVRFRHELRRLNRGEEVRPIKFRNNDFWTEMAEEFNHLREEVGRLREQVAQVETSSDGSTSVNKGPLFRDDEDTQTSEEFLESATA